MLIPNPDRRLHLALWALVGFVFIWSGVHPYDRFTWVMEVFPVVLGTMVLLAYYKFWRFSRWVCWLLAIHAIVLMVGGRYTYALVPFGNWARDLFHLSRNHYDRLGHFLQGFVPAFIAREVLIRRGIVRRGPWLVFVVLSIALAISALYELLEWQAAVWTGTRADAFLGTQGDPWDTQEDMAMALVGAVSAFVFFARIHDRSIERLS